MKNKQKKSVKPILSDKIADALTVQPRADIEDDLVFGTKPRTITKAELNLSDSDDGAAISDFRKRNINLLSDISKKYDGEIVTRKSIEDSQSDNYEESDDNGLSLKDIGLLDDDSEDDERSEAENQPEKTKLNGTISKDVSQLDSESDKADNDSENEELPELKETPSIAKIESKVHTPTDNKSDSDEDSISDESDFKPKSSDKQKYLSQTETDNESDNYDIMQFKKQLEESDEEEEEKDEDSSEDEDENDSNDEEDGEGYDISQLEEPMKEEFEHVKKQNVSEDAKKGSCVRNQLLLWEGLLEMRIHLQRCITTANQMPLPDTHEDLKRNNEFAEECNATKINVSAVLDKFMSLQNILLQKYPETKSLSSIKTKTESSNVKPESDEEIPSDTDNEEIPSDTEDEREKSKTEVSKRDEQPLKATQSKKRKLEDYEKELSTSHKAFKSFRDSTIEKWNEKTRLAAATNIKNKNLPTNTVLQQISYILSDKEKLVKRTQLKRSEYDIIGYKKDDIIQEKNSTELHKTKDRKDNDEYITEIFDDSDFYHQLLRELIECKSADISDPVQLSRQWIALQQMRSKMKRKVDTKATKGRKIKYVVHNKLVNYMAPEKCNTWTDESTNELYSSLFGKMFEQNNVCLNANLDNSFKMIN